MRCTQLFSFEIIALKKSKRQTGTEDKNQKKKYCKSASDGESFKRQIEPRNPFERRRRSVKLAIKCVNVSNVCMHFD